VTERDTLELPPERSSPSQARRWIQPIVVDRVRDMEALLLCVSELVANAVLHAGTRCVLSVDWTDELVRIAVRDFAPERLPVKRSFDRAAMTGRGLHILDSCTVRWGVEQDSNAKSVWFELPVRDRHRASS
jgi:anti-sigma regulatory factor (Ser/Thr protein kinase)